MRNIDWTKPVEYVSGCGTVYPAEYRGEMNSGALHLVVAHLMGGDIVSMARRDGSIEALSRSRIRNIPEPKREPRTVWVPECLAMNYLDWDSADEEGPTKQLDVGNVWRKFVEVVEP